MNNESYLRQGQKIDAIWGPVDSGGGQSGGTVGLWGVTEIEISRCAGPMGWFDVAIIRREGKPDHGDEIVPIHMAEFVRLLPPSE